MLLKTGLTLFQIVNHNSFYRYKSISCINFQTFSDDSRQLASNMRGIGLAAQDVPEWKKHVIGGKKSSFGMKTNLSLLEQRQSLPIYKLKDELIKVIITILIDEIYLFYYLLVFKIISLVYSSYYQN